MKTPHHVRRSDATGNRPWLALVTASAMTALAFGQPNPSKPAPPTEALVVIVNKANTVTNLTSEELRKLFRLEQERWPDGRKNTVLMQPAGTPARDAALRKIYHFSESEFARHFIQLSYAGRSQSAPKELSSAANVRKFIFNVPGAIGYVRASEVDDTVKVVRIDGRLPDDTAYPLRLVSK